MTSTIHGTIDPKFEPLRVAFESAFDQKPNMGAALSVWVDGKEVVNVWAGHSDPELEAAWTPETLTVIFSCTKGLMSLMSAQLVQEKLITYDTKVAEVWPEFAANGKQDVTFGDLLSHRSGLSAPRENYTKDQITDWNYITTSLAAQEPLWHPGTGYAYHAITQGWLAGEVLRRVTGQTVGEYFQQKIAGPLGVPAYIGLPSEKRSSVAKMHVGSTLTELIAQQAEARLSGETDWSLQAMTLGDALPPELVGDKKGFNDPSIQAAEIPAAGGISTASALAKIWSATIIDTDGIRLLHDSTVEEATKVASQGQPVWDVPGPFPRWGMGFQLDSEARRYLTPVGFGHDGAGGQVAFADPTYNVGFAFLTNQMEALNDNRATSIIDSLRRVLA